MRVLTVVGNRPQFIKAAAVSRALRRDVDEILVHTGQHYDDELSSIFFRELDIPTPDIELGVGSGSHAAQTAAVMRALEPVVCDEAPDLVLLYGDTNTTLGAALVAAKAPIALGHVEAGMRSFDRRMPEEQNRVVTDRLSDLLLCPSETAMENLRREGLGAGAALVGDVMLDLALEVAEAVDPEEVARRHGLEPGRYVLATAHRAGTVDHSGRLARLVDICVRVEAPVVFPVHPRTRVALARGGHIERLEGAGVNLLPPLGYPDFQGLLRASRAVMTDSGGVQKEAYAFGVRCVTLRDTTEWVETVEVGWNRLVDLDVADVLAALDEKPPADRPVLYGGGSAVRATVGVIGRFLGGRELGLSEVEDSR